jgi:RNA polymerase sigma-70 factor (ECF subfamily)
MAQDVAIGTMHVSERAERNDRSLVARLQAKDEGALEEIYAQYGRGLFSYANTITNDPELAADVLQNALLAAWRGADAFRGGSSLRTWLFGITRRQALKSIRRTHPEFVDADELIGHPAPDPEPEELALAAAQRDDVATLLARLSPVHREILSLIFFHELAYEEAATVLGVPIGTVKSRLSNAKRASRALLHTSSEEHSR